MGVCLRPGLGQLLERAEVCDETRACGDKHIAILAGFRVGPHADLPVASGHGIRTRGEVDVADTARAGDEPEEALQSRERLVQRARRMDLSSVCEVSAAGGISVVCLQRSIAERDFSPREQRLLNFFHAELGPLVGHALVSATQPSLARLSPRLRQTLACLLEGDSEKQVTARLGLSQATTHQYVTMLYRRFSVWSRAQLLVHVLRRVGNGRPRPVGLETSRHESTTRLTHDNPTEPTT